MQHPQSLDPRFSPHALGSGLRAASARDDDSAPEGLGDERSEVPGAPRFTLNAAELERIERAPESSGRAPAFHVVDVPTFFFFPFDHIAHQCAAEVHGLGSMQRLAIHGAGEPCHTTARALLVSHGSATSAAVEAERESRFSDLEALIVAIDAAIEWLGLDVRPPLDLTLDIDFERDGIVDPNDVTLTVRTTRDAYGRLDAHLVLFHEATAEALVLRTTLAVEKPLPVYPAPKPLPPPSTPRLPGP